MSPSWLLVLLFAFHMCSFALSGPAFAEEESELSEKEIDEAVVTQIERALDTLDTLFKSQKRAANLHRRGWLSKTWNNIKQGAKNFWEENKTEIVMTGIKLILGKRRDVTDSYLALRNSAIESLVDRRDAGDLSTSNDDAKRSLDLISNFITARDSA